MGAFQPAGSSEKTVVARVGDEEISRLVDCQTAGAGEINERKGDRWRGTPGKLQHIIAVVVADEQIAGAASTASPPARTSPPRGTSLGLSSPRPT